MKNLPAKPSLHDPAAASPTAAGFLSLLPTREELLACPRERFVSADKGRVEVTPGYFDECPHPHRGAPVKVRMPVQFIEANGSLAAIAGEN